MDCQRMQPFRINPMTAKSILRVALVAGAMGTMVPIASYAKLPSKEPFAQAPIDFVYRRCDISIPVRYRDAAYRLTEQEKVLLADTLDKLPLQHVQVVQGIVTRAASPQADAVAFATWRGGIILNVLREKGTGRKRYLTDGQAQREAPRAGDSTRHPQTLAFLYGVDEFVKTIIHETGHQVHFHLFSREEKNDWLKWHQASRQPGDFAQTTSANADGSPYGSKDVYEDVATVYEAWGSDTYALWAQAIQAFREGRPALLQKVLAMAAWFTDPRTGEATSYQIQLGNEPPLQTSRVGVLRTATTLKLGHLVFSLNGGQIVSVRSSTNGATLLPSDFPGEIRPKKPIPIPQGVLNRIPLTELVSTASSDSSTPVPISGSKPDFAVTGVDPTTYISPISSEGQTLLKSAQEQLDPLLRNPTDLKKAAKTLPAIAPHPVAQPPSR